MEKFINRVYRGIVSIITTSVLMAAPVAAIIYFSDSTSNQIEYSFEPTHYSVSLQTPADKEEQTAVVRQEQSSEQPVVTDKKDKE